MIKSEKHNVLAEEINKTALRANNEKRIQSVDSMEIYAFGTSKDLVCKKKRLKLSM